MAEFRLPDDQFSALVQQVTKAVLETIVEKQDDGSSKGAKASPLSAAMPQRGRPKSVYTGQLHMKVLPEDEVWFRSLAQALEIQNGKLLNLLRRHFEEREHRVTAGLQAAEITRKI